MTSFLRRLASAVLFTSASSAGTVSQPNEQPKTFGLEDGRRLCASKSLLDLRVEGCLASAQLVQSFLSAEESWNMESYCYFRLSHRAAVTSFKLEIADDHALEDETKPRKQARTQFDQAVRRKKASAVLTEVEPGIYQARISSVQPGIQVTIVVRYAEHIASNADGNLLVTIPTLSASSWSSFSKATEISLNIEIVQDGSIHDISSPTHQKILSVKAGLANGFREVQTFSSLLQSPASPSRGRFIGNKATVNLSGSNAPLDKDFELVIKATNPTPSTAASLSRINGIGHAVLTVTIRPCDLFDGTEDTKWLLQFELNQPWTCCTSDLAEINLKGTTNQGSNFSPIPFKFAQSPKSLPLVSHQQRFSLFFLLDFKGSTEYSLDTVHITASPVDRRHEARTKAVVVKRTNLADDISQSICVRSILRDSYATLLEQGNHQPYSQGQSFTVSSLKARAEDLGQLYSVCSHWNSKIATDLSDFIDGDADANRRPSHEDELCRLRLPTSLPGPAVNATSSWGMTATGHSGRQLQRRQTEHDDLQATTKRKRKAYPDGRHPRITEWSGTARRLAWSSLSHGAKPTQQSSTRQNEYFIPRDGIDRAVITKDIHRYLDNEASLRRGACTDEKTGRLTHGYFITAHRNLTASMIDALKFDSARWQADPANPDSVKTQEGHQKDEVSLTHRHGAGRNAYPSTNANTESWLLDLPGSVPNDLGYPDSGMRYADYPQGSFDAGDRVRDGNHRQVSQHPNHSLNGIPDPIPYFSGGMTAPSVYHNPQGQFHYRDPPLSVPGAQRPLSPVAGGSHIYNKELETQWMWAQILASRTTGGRYILGVDLRRRMEFYFAHRTRRWLVNRATQSFPDKKDRSDLEALADTMLVLAYVKVYVVEHFEDVKQHTGLVLHSWKDQEDILSILCDTH